jgi:hypothetical protein
MACVNYCECKNTDCDKHGKCCECVLSHKERGYLPACLRGKNLPDLPPPKDE